MIRRSQDALFAMTSSILAGIWIWLVVDTIPAGLGDGDLGPRAFPLFFGAALLALSLILLVREWPARKQQRAQVPESLYHMLIVLAEIVAYGFLLQKCGFVIATPVMIALVMVLSLGIRSLRSVLGMAAGVTLGCWVIFEKILGIYLANGSLINLG
ncbi:MAG: tripartite tricarboxylate transporter TctB family protein [Tropicimonas sp.]|uniref:tripartite tricarboxylate transporter TctB family protein n=1 Tax=Tropicimonas sp. TaxID=2067044 RepID=UPI003A894D6B